MCYLKTETLEKKQNVVSLVAQKIEQSAGVILCNYSGLTVKGADEFRSELRKLGAGYGVVKNTMLRRALPDVEGLDEHLHGTTGVVYTGDDFAAAAKYVSEFSTKSKEVITIKCGVMDGAVLSQADVVAISKLPSREVLLAKLLGTLNAPITNFVGVLAGVPRKFLYALNAVKEKKEQE